MMLDDAQELLNGGVKQRLRLYMLPMAGVDVLPMRPQTGFLLRLQILPLGQDHPRDIGLDHSRLAGKSDTTGIQPWANASISETDTESLRGTLRYQAARR